MVSSIPIALFLASIVSAANFSFSYSTPRACDSLTIDWSGGNPPYSLLITPAFGIPVNISIPSDATNSFSTTLPINDSSRFVLTMSDKAGFGTGGTSPLLSPKSTGNNSCQNTVHPPFTFSLPSSLQQCSPFSFTNYNGAAFPLEFIGIIPQGTAFPLFTSDHSSFTWNADVKAGTSIIWVARDAKGRTGGASDILSVQQSSSSSCIKSNSPSSTVSSTSKPDGDHTSGVLGGAIGGSLAAVLILGGALFLWLKKKRKPDTKLSLGADHSPEGLAVPLTSPISGSSSRSSRMRERNHVRPMPEMYDDRPSPSHIGPSDGSLEPNPYTFNPTETEPSESRTRRSSKAGMLSTPRTTRFILHTDAEDAEEEEEEVVELPPQYRPGRGAIAPSPQPRHPQPAPGANTEGHSHSLDRERYPVPRAIPNDPSPSYPPTLGTAL